MYKIQGISLAVFNYLPNFINSKMIQGNVGFTFRFIAPNEACSFEFFERLPYIASFGARKPPKGVGLFSMSVSDIPIMVKLTEKCFINFVKRHFSSVVIEITYDI